MLVNWFLGSLVSSTQSASGLFGSTPGFGTTATATAAGGTHQIKFTPVTGTDTMMKNGSSTSVSTRHYCITCMKEYENKSLEELRLEDYAAGRKGPQQGTQPAGGMFGAPAQPSLFGSTAANTSGGLFGSDNKSLFGTTNQGFGTTGSTNMFGATNQSNSLFGKPAGTATPFGAPATTATNTFGCNNTSTNLFGFNTAQKPFGSLNLGGGSSLFNNSASKPGCLFGQTNTGGNLFGSVGGFGTTNTFNSGTNTLGGLGNLSTLGSGMGSSLGNLCLMDWTARKTCR